VIIYETLLLILALTVLALTILVGSSIITFDKISTSLSNHVSRSLSVSGSDLWHDGGITDSKVSNTSHSEMVINNSHGIIVRSTDWSHLATSNIMIPRSISSLEPRHNIAVDIGWISVRVSGDIQPHEVLNVGARSVSHYLLNDINQSSHISWISKIVEDGSRSISGVTGSQ